MRPEQLFGFVVRVAGLACVAWSSVYLITALFVALAWSHSSFPAWDYLRSALSWLPVGWFLLRHADRVVSYAYRQPQ
jgi:hypothetical protein